MANLTAVILWGVGVTNLLIGVDAEHLWRTLGSSVKTRFVIGEIIENQGEE